MYYQELSPGVFLGTDQKLPSKLVVCPYCGQQEVYSHAKYRDKCVDCGKLYNLYTVRRTRRIHDNLPLKTGYTHLNLIKELLRRRDTLHLKPLADSLDEELAKTVERLRVQEEYQQYLDAQVPTTEVRCSYCGDDMYVPLGSNGPHRCSTCEATYKRYRALLSSVASLDQDGCDALAEIIHYYVRQQRRGYRVPLISRAIPALQCRITFIGGEQYTFFTNNEKV